MHIQAASSIVSHYLSLYLYDNATFLCERIHAEAPSDASIAQLAACYLRQGRPKRAYALLQGAPPASPHNRYLLAVACFKLNKLHEAEGALLADRRLRTRGPLKSQAQLLAKVTLV
jgi:anaphase-promoting complex subunit 3